ncbi:MAG: aldo/keto reductase [Myxococcaceae bacterium]
MNRIALGTMNFGGRTPEPEAKRILDRALDQGGQPWIDTANVYNNGSSEEIVGRAIRGRRDRVFLATKVGLFRKEGLAPAKVHQALEQSLSRLGTDQVDLYYWHAPDPATPFDQTLDAMQALLESRRIRAFGLSNFASWQILELQQLCAKRGLEGPKFSQVLYNLLVRQLDVEYFAFAKAHPVHTTVYNPLAGGLLARGSGTQTMRIASQPLYTRRYGSTVLAERAEAYRAIAKDAGMELLKLAYAWVAQRPGVDSVIVGPGTLEHLDAALVGCTTSLTAETRQRIDALHLELQGTDACYAR